MSSNGNEASDEQRENLPFVEEDMLEKGEPETEWTAPPIPEGEHPLQSCWTLWYAKKPAKDEEIHWRDTLKDLGTFNTVEGFWRTYAHVKRPSQLPEDSNYYLSRDHHYPMWEAFPNGGAWNIKLNKRGEIIDRVWEELILATVGEAFGEPDVVAIVLALRSHRNFVSVWNADNTNAAVRFKIGETLRTLFSVRGLSDTIEYKSHATSMKDGSTFRNAKSYQFAVTGGSDAAASQL